MIQLRNIEKIYQTEDGPVRALSDVSLTIREGEIFGIIGYSGAGKSTLIRLINLLEKPTSGTIIIQDRMLTKLDERELREQRRSIGMIFQHFNLLWSRTVAGNIAFPLELTNLKKKQREARVSELIRLVGLEGRASAYPSQLSGGQKQRVGIARALANNPKVLLCDEATSALDPKTTDSILSLLSDINRKLGLTIVLITHEMNVIRKICDRVAVLDKGRIVEEGSVSEVFSHPVQKITKEFAGSLNGQQTLRFRDEGTIVFLAHSNESKLQENLSVLFGSDVLSVKVLGSACVQGAETGVTLALKGTASDISAALDRLRLSGTTVEVIRHHE
ncbi:methionine ABC transporter ATP-binding protein [Sporolactobacillus mangiferae]|uniref:methionine ABC transporter ATP-binding protein n=1 Tax=Sporolactobacillus mangiferae TaxID=2940498 RepID=UPI0034A2FC93